MRTLLTILTLFILLQITSCISRANFDTITYDTVIADTVIINCDTIFKEAGYSITLITFDTLIENEYNSILLFGKLGNNDLDNVFVDTLYSQVGQIAFADYNNDSIKDILVQNISDVRSNWTYNLFLSDLKNRTLIKINGFDKIKNPRLNSELKIIESYINSGTNYIEFYKLLNQDSIFKYDIFVYDSSDDVSRMNYRLALEKMRSK
jgi:hypothetical protein